MRSFACLTFFLANVALNLTWSIRFWKSKTQDDGSTKIILFDLAPASSSSPPPPPPSLHSSPELLFLSQLKTYRQRHTLFHEPSIPDRPVCRPNDDEWKTTLVLQMSADRGPWLAHLHCQRWSDDPIVMVVYFGNQALWDEWEAIWMEHVVRSHECKNNPNIRFVWVLNEIVPAGKNESNKTDSTTNGPTTVEASSGHHHRHHYYYPINLLRNLGLERVHTSHAFVLDADFVPSAGLAYDIANALRTRQRAAESTTNKDMMNHQRQALVVPVMEYRVHGNKNGTGHESLSMDKSAVYDNPWQASLSIPSTFDDLAVCYQNDLCMAFHNDSAWAGHSSTRTEDWLQKKWYQSVIDTRRNNKTRTKTMDIKRIPCLFSPKYEPYLVVPWCTTPTVDTNVPPTPLFDERFENYGFNKIQYFHQLRMMQFEFFVVPKGFAFHLPHVESNLSRRFRDLGIEFKQRKALWISFQKQLQQRYKKRYAKIKLCPK